MAESLEEARFVERFLIKVSSGTDFTPDIWIERDVKSSGPGGEDTKATSYSGKKVGIKINNLTELLKDDLDHCFRKNYFVFRFISAIAGSGKTTLLSYLQELIEVDYDNGYVVVNSPLPAQTGALTSVQSFHARFYSHILTETLFQLLDKPKVQVVAEYILREILDQESSDQLIGAKGSRISFFTKFNNFTSNARIDLEGAFLTLIRKVLEVDADYAFVYLIDELDDALQEEPSQVQQVREAFKSLHNRTLKEFGDKVRLLVYVAGTSEKLKGLIDSDTAINRRFVDHTIHLGLGVKSEFSKIREKIDKRLERAYRGCDSFDEAQARIQDIDNQLKSTYVGKIKSIGSYCKNYAYAALEIYEEYFSDRVISF